MKTVKLGTYIKTVTPKTKIQAKKFLPSGQYPVISQEAGQINGYWNDADDVMHFPKPVITFGDHTRCIKYIDFDFVAGADGTKILQTPDDLDPRFFYHWLLAHPVEHLGYARHFRILKEMEMEIPSLEEQRRVVEKLDAAFEWILTVEFLIQQNLDNVAVLQKSILQKYLSVDSRAHTRRLADLGLIQTGTTPKTSVKTYYGGDIPFIKPSDFLIDGALSMNGQKLTHEGISAGRLIKENSVLMVCIGATIGKVAYSDMPVSCNQQINTVTLNSLTEAKYLYYAMTSNDFQSKVKGSANQMTLPIINKTAWSKLAVKVPDVLRQKEIVDKIDKALEKSRELESQYTKKLAKLTALRQSLLSQAFSTTNKV